MGSAKNNLTAIYNHVQIFKAARELSPIESCLRETFSKSPKEGTQLVPFLVHRREVNLLHATGKVLRLNSLDTQLREAG